MLDKSLLVWYNKDTEREVIKMFKWFCKIEEWLGCTKRIEYNFNGTTLACYVGCGCFSGMVEFTAYEVRPNKKLFKEKYFGSKWFWLEDYDTIEQGVLSKITEIFEEKEEELIKQDKWKEFLEK